MSSQHASQLWVIRVTASAQLQKFRSVMLALLATVNYASGLAYTDILTVLLGLAYFFEKKAAFYSVFTYDLRVELQEVRLF